MKAYIFLLFYLLSTSLFAQIPTKGKVLDSQYQPLAGATISWEGSEIGTYSDSLGNFSLQTLRGKNLLFSLASYRNDTLRWKNIQPLIDGDMPLVIELKSLETENIEITGKTDSKSISTLNPQLTETLSQKELFKAACCNLGESFQSTASVDVSYEDAISGAKQIRLLGLSGNYAQIITENMPSIRGLATPFGLGYIPGPWMQKIQISKGASSVLNGYEGLTGQINVEYKKPFDEEKLHFNVYANQMGRFEASANVSTKINKVWSTKTLLHGNTYQQNIDHNHDGFLDLPHLNQFAGMNRWHYQLKNIEGQFGVKFLTENRNGGQIAHEGHVMDSLYTLSNQTRRWEAFYKSGWVSPKKAGLSVAMVLNAIRHKQTSTFGYNQYKGLEESFSAKLIYQTILGNSNHSLLAGPSFSYDKYTESWNDSIFSLANMNRKEIIPGIYGEYTYTYSEKFSAVAGFRADYHNLFGMIYTPRVHLRYVPNEKNTFRLSAGKGTRIANIMSDYAQIWASSRAIEIKEQLLPESGWNYGGSWVKTFAIDARDASLVLDFYRTDFQNQVIADREKSGKIAFYNLQGKSFSNTFQAELNIEPLKRLEVRLAWKWNQVRAAMENGVQDVPFVPKTRSLANIAYSFGQDKWKVDATLTHTGVSRIPSTSDNPLPYQVANHSPAFFQLYGQVTRSFKYWDLYLGGENLTNFRQTNPIIAADQPFSPHFDAAMAWGPIVGRMLYVGVRMNVKHKKM